VIGEITTYRVRPGDTLFDVARYYDLGYNEIVEANPGVDPWVPRPGTTLTLPTEWVLPCCTYDGLVLNIPEMRLYYYRRSPAEPTVTTVHTYPVGLGRDDRRTPLGKFRIRGKTVNPQWNIPESIRREHIKERNDSRASIPGGAPDNPLGRYRLELSRPLYAIHGTDIPWGVGMQVSHGCARLYPEDIERLFPMVPVGTRVAFVYQPVKAGTRGGATYIEVHRDIYRYDKSLYQSARAAIDRREPRPAVDAKLLEAAIKQAQGTPTRVSAPGSRQRG
jgi:L,D-transpeptidase ErfK/SrfK